MSEEAAQPVEGQGADAPEGNDLYTAFLDGVPAEIHEQVIPALKAQDAEFTKRFQSLSERTKPFDELGVFDRDVEEVGSYLNLATTLEAAQQGDQQAQEAVYEWWDSIGDALGFYEGQSDGEESDSDLDVDDDFDPYDRNQLTKLLADQIAEQVGPIAEFVEQQAMTQQEQEALASAEAEVVGQIEALQSEHNLSDDVLQEVLELAEMFVEADNPVQAGFEKYQSLVGKGEANLFQEKIQQPGTPEGSGPAAMTPDAITSANVKEKVLERLNQQTQLTG
jgi:hypothetical protein